MRFALFLIAVFAGGPAFAHVGHLGEAAGHDHWVAGAAIGIAIGIGLWGALKDRAKEAASDEEGETDEEAEAA